jgi:protein-disulfide isomerase
VALVGAGNVSYVYKDFVLPQHQPRSQWASEASYCAADQGKYWAYHGSLFEHQKEFTKADLKGYAEALGLDTKQFNSCLDSGKHTDAVKAMTKEAMDAKLPGTPAMFINGKSVPYEQLGNFTDLVNQELKK